MKQMFYVLSFVLIVIVIGNVVIVAQTKNDASSKSKKRHEISCYNGYNR